MLSWVFGTTRVKTFVVVTGGTIVRSRVLSVDIGLDILELCDVIYQSKILAFNEQLQGMYYIIPTTGERVAITRHITNLRTVLYHTRVNIYLDVVVQK